MSHHWKLLQIASEVQQYYGNQERVDQADELEDKEA